MLKAWKTSRRWSKWLSPSHPTGGSAEAPGPQLWLSQTVPTTVVWLVASIWTSPGRCGHLSSDSVHSRSLSLSNANKYIFFLFFFKKAKYLAKAQFFCTCLSDNINSSFWEIDGENNCQYQGKKTFYLYAVFAVLVPQTDNRILTCPYYDKLEK